METAFWLAARAAHVVTHDGEVPPRSETADDDKTRRRHRYISLFRHFSYFSRFFLLFFLHTVDQYVNATATRFVVRSALLYVAVCRRGRRGGARHTKRERERASERLLRYIIVCGRDYSRSLSGCRKSRRKVVGMSRCTYYIHIVVGVLGWIRWVGCFPGYSNSLLGRDADDA